MSSRGDRQNQAKQLQDLASHLATYVTVNELAEYWMISRKQIYKQIEMGYLPAIRLGPRLLRIRTIDALQFERSASSALAANDTTPPVAPNQWTAPREIARPARLTAAKIDLVKR
jgi:excisionase family DNA binding protein